MEQSPALLARFPDLKFLKVNLLYFNPSGLAQIGELKYSVNVSNAECMFVFACRSEACACGDFDLSEAFDNALRSRSNKIEGEIRCAGTLVVSLCLTSETRTTFRRDKLISNSVSRYPASMQCCPREHQLHAEPCRQAYGRMV